MLKYLIFFVTVLSLAEFSSSLTWCCKSVPEMKKCENFRERLDNNGQKAFDFNCFESDSIENCIHAIENGFADIIALDGGDIFHYRNKITVIAAEDHGSGDASYFAVAVVRKGHLPRMTLRSLDGKRTCHTGVGKTSGWNMPIGWLYRNNLNPDGFSASCAPGAKKSPYTEMLPGYEADSDDHNPLIGKWCALCHGNEQGDHKCDRDSDELYYGYSGALRCMDEGRGDVAFVKHTTVPKNLEDNYDLLCPNLQRAHPSRWAECTFGRVPSHAIVMRANTPEQNATRAFSILQHAFNTIPRNDFTRFRGKNLLWSSSTVSFLPRITTPVSFLGRQYYCNMLALTNKNGDDPSCQ